MRRKRPIHTDAKDNEPLTELDLRRIGYSNFIPTVLSGIGQRFFQSSQ